MCRCAQLLGDGQSFFAGTSLGGGFLLPGKVDLDLLGAWDFSAQAGDSSYLYSGPVLSLTVGGRDQSFSWSAGIFTKVYVTGSGTLPRVHGLSFTVGLNHAD